MDRRSVSAEQVLRAIRKCGVEYIRLETLDIAGIVRCRVVRPNLLEKVFDEGLNMSKAIFSFTVLEHMVPKPKWGPQDADFYMFPDTSTYVQVPYLEKTSRMYTWLLDEKKHPWEGDTRGNLKAALGKIAQKKLEAVAAFEAEGYLLRRANGGHEPADHSRCFTADGLDIQHALLNDVFNSLNSMGISTEKATAEYGPGQYEVNFGHRRLLEACDNFVTFRQAWRAIARKHGLLGTFMPKPIKGLAGSGLHLHLNLVDSETGRNAFFDKRDKRGIGLSGEAYHFLGGLLEHASALVAIGAPSVNSYKRLRPGTWAPTHASYGVGNRSVMIRVPRKMSASTRLEFRAADGTCNPYLLAHALLAAGMHGMEEEMDTGPPTEDDIGSRSDAQAEVGDSRRLPESLLEAITALKEDDDLIRRVSVPVLEEFIKIKRAEWDDYQDHVSEWETRTYMDTF